MMLVNEIMTDDPVSIDQNAAVSRALKLMLELEYQQLPVTSEAGHLVGLVSQRDCRRALGLGDHNGAMPDMAPSGEDPPVHRHMQPAPIIVEPETTVHEAARLMTSHHIRALPVMRGESLVGIITVSDLLIAFMRTLRKYERTDEVLDDGTRRRIL
jgi:acetoin utilization protein AcuB